MRDVLVQGIRTGLAVSAATSAVLAFAAAARGRPAVAPSNATSHWMHGEKAGATVDIDAEHTALGQATHTGASIFWSVLFHAWRKRRSPGTLMGDAVATAAVAGVVDYAVVPKRLTPGWELVLPKSDIALTYAVMALALAASERREEEDRLRLPTPLS